MYTVHRSVFTFRCVQLFSHKNLYTHSCGWNNILSAHAMLKLICNTKLQSLVYSLIWRMARPGWITLILPIVLQGTSNREQCYQGERLTADCILRAQTADSRPINVQLVTWSTTATLWTFAFWQSDKMLQCAVIFFCTCTTAMCTHIVGLFSLVYIDKTCRLATLV